MYLDSLTLLIDFRFGFNFGLIGKGKKYSKNSMKINQIGFVQFDSTSMKNKSKPNNLKNNS